MRSISNFLKPFGGLIVALGLVFYIGPVGVSWCNAPKEGFWGWLLGLIGCLIQIVYGLCGWIVSMCGVSDEIIAQPFIFLIIGVGILYFVWFNKIRSSRIEEAEKIEKQKRQEELAAKKAQDDAHNAAIKLKKSRIARGRVIENRIKSLSQAAVYHATYAKRHLELAKNEFEENVFRPFWVAVKNVTQNLGMYHRCISEIDKLLTEYKELRKFGINELGILDSRLFKFPSVRETVIGLQVIQRNAEKHEQFSSAASSFRIEQTLLETASNLQSAIYSMSEAISSSIESLSLNLGLKMDNLIDANISIGERIDHNIAELSSNLLEDFNSRSGEMVKELTESNVMLDNIQRNRDPDRIW